MTASAPAGKLLVVEDNPANQLLMTAVLRRAGFEVLVASSAEEARVTLSEGRPDAILMDIQLPQQDGLSFTRDLLADEATCDIPVIALTAHAMRGDEELARDAGCIGYLTKPIDTRALLGALEGILSQSRHDQESTA